MTDERFFSLLCSLPAAAKSLSSNVLCPPPNTPETLVQELLSMGSNCAGVQEVLIRTQLLEPDTMLQHGLHLLVRCWHIRNHQLLGSHRLLNLLVVLPWLQLRGQSIGHHEANQFREQPSPSLYCKRLADAIEESADNAKFSNVALCLRNWANCRSSEAAAEALSQICSCISIACFPSWAAEAGLILLHLVQRHNRYRAASLRVATLFLAQEIDSQMLSAFGDVVAEATQLLSSPSTQLQQAAEMLLQTACKAAAHGVRLGLPNFDKPSSSSGTVPPIRYWQMDSPEFTSVKRSLVKLIQHPFMTANISASKNPLPAVLKSDEIVKKARSPGSLIPKGQAHNAVEIHRE